MIVRKIGEIIENAGIATFATNLYAYGFKEDFDNAACLFPETGAVQPYQSDYSSDWVGLQVITRGFGEAAEEMAWDIHNAISGLHSLQFDDLVLSQTSIQNVPAYFDTDEKGRLKFTAHYMYLIAQRDHNNRIPLLFETFDETFDETFA